MKTLWFEIFITLLIFKTATLFTISCSYRFRKFVAIGEVYECLASNIPILSGNTITGVSGTHSSGWNNNDVTSLDIRGGRTLSFIPRGATDFFPNIIALLIQDTTMDTLWGNEFNEFRKIKYLSITYGQLTTIPSRFFENLPNIIYIIFNSNLIKYTGYDLFAPLDINKLQGLYFHNNECISYASTTQAGIAYMITLLRDQCSRNCVIGNVQERLCELKDEIGMLIDQMRRSVSDRNDQDDRIARLEAELAIRDEKIMEFMNTVEKLLAVK